jgi:hypothetical protein
MRIQFLLKGILPTSHDYEMLATAPLCKITQQVKGRSTVHLIRKPFILEAGEFITLFLFEN